MPRQRHVPSPAPEPDPLGAAKEDARQNVHSVECALDGSCPPSPPAPPHWPRWGSPPSAPWLEDRDLCAEIANSELIEVSSTSPGGWCKALDEDPTVCVRSYVKDGPSRVWPCEYRDDQCKIMLGGPRTCRTFQSDLAERINNAPPIIIAAVSAVAVLCVLLGSIVHSRRMKRKVEDLERLWGERRVRGNDGGPELHVEARIVNRSL